jgi:hypothetical protein
MQKNFRITKGMVVKTSDGAVLGKVETCENESFCIAKGLFFPEDFCAKSSEVQAVINGEIYLTQSREDLLCHEYEEGIPSFQRMVA